MAQNRFDLHGLSDRQVLEGVRRLHHTSAEVMADLLCHLNEVDKRSLHLREGAPSLFKYAVDVLHCSEDEAWRRTQAARTAGKYPVVFELVAHGELTLTAVNKLTPVLTDENHAAVLVEARHMTKVQVEELVARLAPKPDVAPRLARLPEPKPRAAAPSGDAPAGGVAATPAAQSALALAGPALPLSSSPASVGVTVGPVRVAAVAPAREPGRLEPLSPQRWGLRVTLGAAAVEALRQAQDLTRNTDLHGDLALIVERAVLEYAERLECRKRAKLKRPKSTGEPKVAPASAAPEPAAVEPSTAPAAAAAPSPALARQLPVADEHRVALPPTSGRRPHTPRPIIRAVHERDGNRCAYISPDGRRCSETSGLHIHHVVPYALGGQPTLEHLSLRCPAHDQYQAVLDFGAAHMAEAVRRRRRGPAKRGRSPVRPGV